MKKIVKISLGFLMIGIICLTPVMAEDDFSMLDALGITPFSEDTIVDVDGISFNIPKGYGEKEELSKDNEIEKFNDVNFIVSSRQYQNDDANMIFIDVSYDEHQLFDSIDNLTKDSDATKKTINGHEGYLKKDDNLYSFEFVQDAKIVDVSVDDEKLLSSVII